MHSFSGDQKFCLFHWLYFKVYNRFSLKSDVSLIKNSQAKIGNAAPFRVLLLKACLLLNKQKIELSVYQTPNPNLPKYHTARGVSCDFDRGYL